VIRVIRCDHAATRPRRLANVIVSVWLDHDAITIQTSKDAA